MAIRVIDTDVWSYLYKGRAEAKLYEPHLQGNILVVSFQTQAELLRWAIAAGWGDRRRQDLESRLQNYVIEHSSDALSLRWAEVMEVDDVMDGQFPRRMRGLPRPRCMWTCHLSHTTKLTSLALTG